MAEISPFRVRAARPDEAVHLTDLCIRAKAHWGYSQNLMNLWRDELTVRPEAIETGIALVAENSGGTAVGFGTIDLGQDPPELALLFVEPAWHGRGIGRALLDALSAALASRGTTSLTIDADPNAEGFYTRAGARRVGEIRSAAQPGRRLPRLSLPVPPASPPPPQEKACP